MKIYVDGCSYAAAHGLDSKFTLANLIDADFDASYKGKSNESIFHDTYSNVEKYDLFVISLTYANRFVLFENFERISIFPTQVDCPTRLKDTKFENLYSNYHKIIYTLYDQNYFSKISDGLIDCLIALWQKQNKKFVIYSWEPRNNFYKDYIETVNFDSAYFLPDKHLNEAGMKFWAEKVLLKINDK